ASCLSRRQFHRRRIGRKGRIHRFVRFAGNDAGRQADGAEQVSAARRSRGQYEGQMALSGCQAGFLRIHLVLRYSQMAAIKPSRLSRLILTLMVRSYIRKSKSPRGCQAISSARVRNETALTGDSRRAASEPARRPMNRYKKRSTERCFMPSSLSDGLSVPDPAATSLLYGLAERLAIDVCRQHPMPVGTREPAGGADRKSVV